MPLDGITLNCLKNELNELAGAKISRISQPGKLDLVLTLYKNSNHKLLITANASNARVNLIDQSPDNPLVAPNFCMLLRKHLQGGTIHSFQQLKLDRVMKINIKSYDEMGYPVTKALIVEIMGRHSNIILVDENMKIIDAIKRIGPDKSRVRLILPGQTYHSLEDKKVDVLQDPSLPSQLIDRQANSQVHKLFYQSYTGMSPAIGREICFRAGLPASKALSDLDSTDLAALDKGFMLLVQAINRADYQPSIVFSKDRDRLLDFYAFPLHHLEGEIKAYTSINQVLDVYHETVSQLDSKKGKKDNLVKLVKDNINKLNKKIDDRKAGIKTAQARDKYKVYADLLSANFHKLKGGEESIQLENFYSEDMEVIEIPLDPSKSGPQNAQHYYKAYSKEKNREKIFKKDLPFLEHELLYLQNILTSFDNADSLEDLEEIEEELEEQGYKKKKQKKKKKKDRVSKPLEFLSSAGDKIYVGKNNRQNDELTMKFANKDDYFFHVRNRPGSHVIVRPENSLSNQTILEAAYLAGKYSSISNEKLIDVDFTEKKNVGKSKGAKPGMVYYSNNQTITVDMTDESLNQAFAKKKPQE